MGNTAKKAPQGEYEKALIENATTISDRNKRLYRPLEAGFVKESGRDFSQVLGGRANADAAQAFSSSQGAGLGTSNTSGGFGSGRSMMGQTRQGVIQNDALGGALGSAYSKAQSVKDTSQLGALKTGQGGRSIAMQGLSNAARAQNSELVSKARAASSMQSTNMALGNDLGAGLYQKHFKKTDTTELDKLQKQIDVLMRPDRKFTMGP